MMDPLPHPHRAVLDAELRRVREVILTMGDHVDQAITLAISGLVNRDVALCSQVIADDARLNDLQREARELSFTVILTQSPVARDLREIMGFMHMAAELERMGDHCVSIAKIARNLADLPEMRAHVDLPRMAEYCADQVRDMLSALVARDPERARAVADRDDRVDRIYHRLFDDLVQLMIDNSDCVYRATNLIFIAHHLERIGDRVTNLAEDLLFLETGRIEELG
ncbi:MAG: phosphate signaling complex protein PhoU [Chloroflexi bacterium]|nr:MAG: phosphate signaling complex protein PhoU [Chloroflexota bacterium]